ncbi:hypothetical protein QTH90_15165 [Variovorax sp. J2P1-59]|uniref:hypothetical protein n=1 Tax=Variovorax flavidus TaxID=3053501 RepID=UPI002575C02C|nr:hypothetical protein [Variovorax sp. J2P1-59]MDM0075741.1 hypothetical protein [Variovorax sp. J2P1-59]
MFDYFSPRERQIRKALKIIAGQRVTMIVQPHNILVIEKSPISTEWFEVAVQTCRIRGWVEVLHEGLPSAELHFVKGQPVSGPAHRKTHYRLTEGGWNAIRGTHALVIVAIVLSALSLGAGVASVALTWEQMTGSQSTKAP